MGKMKNLLKLAGLVLLLQASLAAAEEPVGKAPPDAMKLTAEDYTAIQQLAVRYAWLLDHCTNGGYDYADLYVDDGQFSAAEDWGTTSNSQRTFIAKGRDALARAAGGGEDGKCADPQKFLGYGLTHIVTNHLITPSRTGAIGRHRLIAIGVCGYPHLMELQGGYEDVYVKTKDGWKFQSRIHVFKQSRSLQFGVCPRKED
jgi:SnoaL-like domain